MWEPCFLCTRLFHLFLPCWAAIGWSSSFVPGGFACNQNISQPNTERFATRWKTFTKYGRIITFDKRVYVYLHSLETYILRLNLRTNKKRKCANLELLFFVLSLSVPWEIWREFTCTGGATFGFPLNKGEWPSILFVKPPFVSRLMQFHHPTFSFNGESLLNDNLLLADRTYQEGPLVSQILRFLDFSSGSWIHFSSFTETRAESASYESPCLWFYQIDTHNTM